MILAEIEMRLEGNVEDEVEVQEGCPHDGNGEAVSLALELDEVAPSDPDARS